MLIFFLSLMIPGMNRGSAGTLVVTHNHKNVRKIKNDSKGASDWHRGNQPVLK